MTPQPTRTVAQAREQIAEIEVLLKERIDAFEDEFDAEIVAIHLTKTASGNVRVQRTILVQIEVRL